MLICMAYYIANCPVLLVFKACRKSLLIPEQQSGIIKIVSVRSCGKRHNLTLAVNTNQLKVTVISNTLDLFLCRPTTCEGKV